MGPNSKIPVCDFCTVEALSFKLLRDHHANKAQAYKEQHRKGND